jgi:ABC-2 type transport system permease protein
LRGVLAGCQLQFWFFRKFPDQWIPLLTAPLYTIIFAMVIRHAGRDDLSGYALVAPYFIAMWWFALFQGGSVIQSERRDGTIVSLAAAPTSFALVVLGRIVAVMLIGLLSFGEVWLFGTVVLGLDVTIHRPGVFVATMLATAFAMATTALLFAGLFVLTRSAATFTNSASYPFYVLGGIIVPVTFLPIWIQPLSKVVFLSWSADLLRLSLAPGPAQGIAGRLGAIVALGVAALVIALLMMQKILRRVSDTGELDFQ